MGDEMWIVRPRTSHVGRRALPAVDRSDRALGSLGKPLHHHGAWWPHEDAAEWTVRRHLQHGTPRKIPGMEGHSPADLNRS